MTTGLKTIVYPVQDLAAGKAVFAALLGVEPDVDEAYYVGFTAAGQHVGLDPHGHARGLTGPVDYWHVEDVVATLAALLAAGAGEHQPPQDVGGGKLVASVTDPDGNLIGLVQAP